MIPLLAPCGAPMAVRISVLLDVLYVGFRSWVSRDRAFVWGTCTCRRPSYWLGIGGGSRGRHRRWRRHLCRYRRLNFRMFGFDNTVEGMLVALLRPYRC